MTPEDVYLGLSPESTRHLGGLHWSASGTTIDTDDDLTFFFTQPIAHFLEGILAVRPPLPFIQVLHLLHLVGYGPAARPPEAELLARLFADLKRPLRNAGVLFGHLTRDVPPVAGPLDTTAILNRLRSGLPFMGKPPVVEPPEIPALPPTAFETLVLERLRGLTLKDLSHWLRHGREPLKEGGDQLAREFLAVRPRTLESILGVVAQRERLARAVPLLGQLVSALTLPPRRLTERALPMGGYSDVATRGQPEQILPAQFALDDLEFLRRFAANELLYFRREEPRTHVREEMVILMDQGVRTWGDVRLVLVAAVLALGKNAGRRKILFKVAGTSSGGRSLDPLMAEEAAVGALLEASDLTPHPGLALETVLETGEGLRDVVLLTHPRSLEEPDVQAAARRMAPGTRLFTLAVNAGGDSLFAELRHGAPVPLSRFHVDLTQKLELMPAPPAVVTAEPAGLWQGNVEPIGYPFRFGISRRGGRFLFDFDHEGQWIVTATKHGMLFASRTDGTARELLSRPFFEGKVLQEVEVVRGVAGGVVVAGGMGMWLLVAHYDWAKRSCKVHHLGQAQGGPRQWFYFRSLHSIAVRKKEWVFGLDLATGEKAALSQGVESGSGRARAACEQVLGINDTPPELTVFQSSWRLDEPPPQLAVVKSSRKKSPPLGEHLCFDSAAGALALPHISSEWHVPQANGLRFLQGAEIHRACLAREVLVLSTTGGTVRPGTTLWLIDVKSGSLFRDVKSGSLFREFPFRREAWGFTLSSDGSWLARQVGPCQVEVSNLSNNRVVRTPTFGHFHQSVKVGLGPWWLALDNGGYIHFLHWKWHKLLVRTMKQSHIKWPETFPAVKTRLPDCTRYDPHRFIAGVKVVLSVAVDTFGQVAVIDASDRVICMFFAFQKNVAAWMPDGTRFGPASLTGGPPSPNAAEVIGRALAEAAGIRRPES